MSSQRAILPVTCDILVRCLPIANQALLSELRRQHVWESLGDHDHEQKHLPMQHGIQVRVYDSCTTP